MQTLTIRPTRRQLACLGLATGAFGAVALGVLAGTYVANVGWLGSLVPAGVASGICAPFLGWTWARYARSVTVCDADGIRSRGLAREWRCDWQFVAEISIRTGVRNSSLRTVVVRTTAGDQRHLGMPVTGGVMPDADFDDKVRQIRACWQAAAGADHRAYAVPPVSVLPGRLPGLVDVRTVVRTSIAATLLAAVIAVVLIVAVGAGGRALLARLGGGQPGSGDLVHPSGGSTWILLAATLLVILGCLPPTVIWAVRWRRDARLQPAPRDRQPGAAGLPPGRTMTGNSFRVILGLEIVALTAAVVAIGIQSSRVPRASSPAALACARYSAWVLAQPDTGPPRRDPALLADAAREAPAGRLGTDLAGLQSDVAAAIAAPSEELALGAQAIVLADMNVVDRDCKI